LKSLTHGIVRQLVGTYLSLVDQTGRGSDFGGGLLVPRRYCSAGWLWFSSALAFGTTSIVCRSEFLGDILFLGIFCFRVLVVVVEAALVEASCGTLLLRSLFFFGTLSLSTFTSRRRLVFVAESVIRFRVAALLSLDLVRPAFRLVQSLRASDGFFCFCFFLAGVLVGFVVPSFLTRRSFGWTSTLLFSVVGRCRFLALSYFLLLVIVIVIVIVVVIDSKGVVSIGAHNSQASQVFISGSVIVAVLFVVPDQSDRCNNKKLFFCGNYDAHTTYSTVENSAVRDAQKDTFGGASMAGPPVQGTYDRSTPGKSRR
jgi:hypothetical protein